jgi:hypothetical protein
LYTKGPGESLEVLLLARMDVQLVAAAGRNDKFAAQQPTVRIPERSL